MHTNARFRSIIRRYGMLVILFLAVSLCSSAQEEATSQQHAWQAIIGEMMDDSDEDVAQWESMYDALCDLEQSPVDINHATREDLERIPFLSDDEVADILEYIYRNQEMKTTAELAMIRSLTFTNRRMLPYFIVITPVEKRSSLTLKNIIKYGENILTATGNIPLYERKGDKNGYMGYKYRHSIRYEYRYTDNFRLGIVGAQDAGEPFFSGRNSMGYDFYSYYLSIRKLGRLKALTLGRYKVKMGMGLLVNNDFSIGKTTSMASFNKAGTAIRPHSSRSSGNYMQGGAATVRISPCLDLTAFVSYRYIDATLNNDDGSIATILKTGYHRTETEMKKKNNASQFAAGANLSFMKSHFVGGVSAYYTSLDKRLSPNTNSLYRRYYPHGERFYGMSVDYGYRSGLFSFRGETATGSSHAWATINTMSYRLASNFTMRLVQRYYSYKYYSLFSQSYSDGGRVQNESGVYVGADWKPFGGLLLSYYADAAYFPWARYQASTASRSFDNLFSAVYTTGRLTLTGRYRLKKRQKDNADKTALIYKTDQRARLAALYDGGSWSIKAQIDGTTTVFKERSNGYMASLGGGTTAIRRFAIYATCGYFHTDDYYSSIYSYERGMLYDFSFPSYYGEGIRYALIVKYMPTKRLYVMAKAGTTTYFDRSQVGTALQQVDASSLTDIQLQLRWKF